MIADYTAAAEQEVSKTKIVLGTTQVQYNVSKGLQRALGCELLARQTQKCLSHKI